MASTATAAYLARSELLIGRDPRPAVLLAEVEGLWGKTYPPGTEIRVAAGNQGFDGFVHGDWLMLERDEFALT
jgi:hypothetical protein